MIKNLLIIASMAVFTLAVSYVMIPRPKEIALMQLKSKDFETARTSYEAQLAKGDYSVSVAVPLSEVYLHTGDIERAIGLMEKFLDHNPNHVTGLWRLGQYFEEAQKPHGQVRALARLAELEHDEDVLRELAGRHDLLSNENGEAEALEQLIEERDATVDEYDRLARHQASKGQLRKAVATLATLQDRHADTAEAESIELLISLKLDLGDTLGAVNIANESLETRNIQGLGVALAAVFAEKRRPDLALRILRPQTERFPKDITLLAAAVQYEAKLGNTQAALQRLQSFSQTQPLPESLAFDSIVLLMAENSPDQAIAVLQRQNPDRVPEWLVRTILTGSAELGRPDLPGMLAAFLGDSYFAAHPVLAAEIFTAMNNKAEAEIWVSWAEKDHSLPYRDQLVLARLYYDVDRPKQGLALLKRLAAQTGSGTGNLSELADLYLTADRASDGLMIFERLRKSEPSKKTETAWARLAAKSRRAGPVLRWIRSTPDIAPNVLEEIFRSADSNRQPALALAAAERLQAVDPGVKERRLRARAYAALGNIERSKALFSGLVDDNVQFDSDDLAALSLIGATDHLDTYWSTRGESTDGNRLATMFADARRAAVRLVLPRLEKLARSKGGFWLDTYTESARLAGEMGQLKGFLKAEAERSNLSPEDTRKIATTLFDVAPTDSVALFARMAAQNPKAWGDAYIDTLLGLDRTAELVRFLQSEVNRPGIPQSLRDNRLYALIDAGGAASALQPLKRLANSEGGNWANAYEEALISLGKDETLYDFLVTKAERPNLDAEERNGIAFRLLEGGRKNAAERNFLALASGRGPEDPAVRQLLYLWGPRPETHQLDWLEQRANIANGAERATWLTYLNDRGASDRVIRIVESNPPPPGIDGPESKVYLNAVVAKRDSKRLSRVIRDELTVETTPKSVRRLAKLAVQENLPDVATEAYRSLFELRPGDVEAAGWLGRVAYAKGQREEALKLIGFTLGKDKDNYESHYIYGELLYADERRSEALPHLHTALERIQAAPVKTLEMRLALGQTLFRLGQMDDAIKVYAQLYAERGDDPGIRADYASLLIDAREYDRAQAVLWSN